MELTLEMVILVAAGGFLAAFIDSVVGGGGLISVPVLLTAGLPPHLALGTNKLAGTLSSLTSTLTFMRSGYVDWRGTGKLVPLTAIGAAGGALLLQQVSSDWMRPIIVAMLIAVTLYTLLKRDWGAVRGDAARTLSRAGKLGMAAAALLLGGYDGFFGPGTGSFLIFAFLLSGLDFVQAAGNAKLLNFTSNVCSLVVFLLLGQVAFGIGLVMGAAMVAGSLIGSRIAIKQGSRYVRLLFLAVSLVLIARQVWLLLA
ncbi:TSUP family transporter [Cohnella thailandensis]|uniref:Probable membrane transporter protein n=1 Tax=Cohnella thailandensis TaxID=557557 RepID=A0A841ST02_9BACL|nr:TSUP family transporter [Cohnella thailandensis]MBB6633040.1 TSUP family transporter [Cohnella thailandensis]MBP1975265.1 putative membrane protein YfcA [Cohnella thailandensis]